LIVTAIGDSGEIETGLGPVLTLVVESIIN